MRRELGDWLVAFAVAVPVLIGFIWVWGIAPPPLKVALWYAVLIAIGVATFRSRSTPYG